MMVLLLVVIATCEATTTRRTVESLLNQTGWDAEVLVVGDRLVEAG